MYTPSFRKVTSIQFILEFIHLALPCVLVHHGIREWSCAATGPSSRRTMEASKQEAITHGRGERGISDDPTEKGDDSSATDGVHFS